MAIEEDDFFVDFSRKDEEENVSLSEQDNEEYFVDFSKAGENDDVYQNGHILYSNGPISVGYRVLSSNVTIDTHINLFKSSF